MSEEDGTADCSNMILTSVGLQSFLFLRRKSRGLRAGATPASDTFRGQRQHSPTHPYLTTPRQLNAAPELPLSRTHFVTRDGTLQRAHTWQRLDSHSQRCAGATTASDTFRDQRRHSTTHPHLATPRQSFSTLRRSYSCLGHISWPEAALSNARHLATPRQSFSTMRRSYHCLGHISWPEAALSNAPIPGNASAAILNAAPELPLSRTHFVTRGDALQRTHIWQRLDRHSQRCCGDRSDPSMGQNRQPFDDVHPARGDGQSPVTFKRRAEISSHTRKMCSTTAPDRIQGVSFFAETEERKQELIIFPEIAWRHTHRTLCRLAFTTEKPKQTDQWTVCDRDLLSDSFSRSCLYETKIQQNCITQAHTVTKPEPQHFVTAKHTMKTDQDAKRDVQTPLYARQACNTTDHRWRDWRYTPGHLVTLSDFQYFPRVWNTSTQLRDEMIQDNQCAFSLSKVICSRPQLFHILWKFLIQAPNCTGQDFVKNVHTKKCLLQAISSPSKWRGSDKSV